MKTIVQGDRTLIFMNRKRDCDWLCREMNRAGVSTVALHGDMAQHGREQAMQAFRSSRATALVATDVAARGLDISEVKHVINYDMPMNIDDYVHRIGRTGRAGHKGLATSFMQQGQGGDDGIAKDLVSTLRESKVAVPDWLADYGDSVMGRRGGNRGTPRSRGGQFGHRSS